MWIINIITTVTTLIFLILKGSDTASLLLILIISGLTILITAILKLMVEIFMINQLMIQLNNMMKLERYQQEKVMITQLVVY